jgi:hypothetical protein
MRMHVIQIGNSDAGYARFVCTLLRYRYSHFFWLNKDSRTKALAHELYLSVGM